MVLFLTELAQFVISTSTANITLVPGDMMFFSDGAYVTFLLRLKNFLTVDTKTTRNLDPVF